MDRLADWICNLVCRLHGHRFKVVEIWWGGIDYERIVRCERCNKHGTDADISSVVQP